MRKTTSQTRRAGLLESLAATARDLTAARLGFEQEADRDLIAYYLHEQDALRAKHTYLLRQVKLLDEEVDG